MYVPLLLLLGFLAWSPAVHAVSPPAGYPKGEQVGDVLTQYGKFIGKTVLLDPNVQGIISIDFPEGADDAKKAELIEKQVFLNGFTLYDDGAGVVEVLGLGKQIKGAPIPFYTKTEEFPVRERAFAYVYKVQHRDPLVLANILGQNILPSATNGFIPDRDSHTLVIVERTSVMKRILGLLAAVDIPVDPPGPPAGERPFIKPVTPASVVPESAEESAGKDK